MFDEIFVDQKFYSIIVDVVTGRAKSDSTKSKENYRARRELVEESWTQFWTTTPAAAASQEKKELPLDNEKERSKVESILKQLDTTALHNSIEHFLTTLVTNFDVYVWVSKLRF